MKSERGKPHVLTGGRPGLRAYEPLFELPLVNGFKHVGLPRSVFYLAHAGFLKVYSLAP